MLMKLSSGRFLGEVQKSVQLPIARLSESRYVAGQHQPKHTHELPHIALTVAGAYCESFGRLTRTVGSGSLTFYHPDIVHSEKHLLNGTHFLMEIHPRSESFIETLVHRFMKTPEASTQQLSLAWHLYQEFKQPDDLSALILEAVTLELLVEVFRAEFTAVEKQRPIWLNRVLEIARMRFTNPPSLSEIAREVGVHPVHLAKTFRQIQRVTLGEYMRRLRIDLAREKLANTSEPLAQIALQTGFSDQTHLTKVFKRLTGTTPLRFRRLSRH